MRKYPGSPDAIYLFLVLQFFSQEFIIGCCQRGWWRAFGSCLFGLCDFVVSQVGGYGRGLRQVTDVLDRIRSVCEEGARGLILETEEFQCYYNSQHSSNKVFASAKCIAFECGICCSFWAGTCPGRRWVKSCLCPYWVLESGVGVVLDCLHAC